MRSQDIIGLLKKNLIEIIPELEDEVLDINEKLSDIGANSIDRAELITLTLESLELEVPRTEFVEAKTISELAELFVKNGADKVNLSTLN